MPTKRICRDCGHSEWESVIRNFVHDEPNLELMQCTHCKRVVVFDPSEDEYDFGRAGYDWREPLESVRV